MTTILRIQRPELLGSYSPRDIPPLDRGRAPSVRRANIQNVTSGERPVARRHHTVPQFYLQGFARDGQIATIGLPGDRRFVQSTRDASVVKDYYTLAGHNDGDDVLERALSEVEGATAKILGSIVDGTWPLEPDQRTTLGTFVALQAVRVPVHRRTGDYLAAQLLRLEVGANGKAGLRRRLEESGQTSSETEVQRLWEEATRPEGPPVVQPVEVHIKQMLDLAEDLVPHVTRRPWTLVRFERRSLITSDAPVGLVREAAAEPWMGAGYATASAITFPLTRKLGLLMSSPEPLFDAGLPLEDLAERVILGTLDHVEPGSTAYANLFNQHTAAQASQWVFHHPEDEQFVPAKLPKPRPVNLSSSAEALNFDGEPWFAESTVNEAQPDDV